MLLGKVLCRQLSNSKSRSMPSDFVWRSGQLAARSDYAYTLPGIDRSVRKGCLQPQTSNSPRLRRCAAAWHAAHSVIKFCSMSSPDWLRAC
jgi:hypothetical protein